MTVLEGRRVAILGPVPPIRGGIAQHTSNIAIALEARGAEVEVFTWSQQYPRLLYRGPQIDPTASPLPARRSMRWWDPTSWLATASRIRAFGPDALFVPWVTPFHAIPYRVVLGSVEADIVAHVHNAEPHESLPFVRPLTRLGLGPVDRVVTHAHSIVDDLRDLGLDRPADVLPHPPNIGLRQAVPPNRPPLRLLFLGFVRPYKGADLAVAALEHLDDVELTIAGEFWVDLGAFEQEVSARGLGSRVTILDGYLPDDALQPLLDGHHAVIAPYRSATQSGIVPLAFAAGRPVIATDVGGLSESVEDGVNGIIAAPDPTSLAAAIVRLEEHVEELSAGAAEAATSWDQYVTQVFGPRRDG